MIGTGRPLVRRRRAYLVKAECNVRLGFWARDEEDAEDQFNEYMDSVQSRYPDLVLDIKSIREDDE